MHKIPSLYLFFPLLIDYHVIIVSFSGSPSQSSPSTQDRAGPSDLQSFSESLKTRFNAVSTRYKCTLILLISYTDSE